LRTVDDSLFERVLTTYRAMRERRRVFYSCAKRMPTAEILDGGEPEWVEESFTRGIHASLEHFEQALQLELVQIIADHVGLERRDRVGC